MASPFTTADPSDPGSGSVPPGEPSARYIDPREMAANALWTLGNRAVNDIYTNIIQPPGKILTGELTPSMEPGPNQLSIPEYAKDLALQGFGIRGANLITTGGRFDPATLEHFGAWQGTPVNKPFSAYDDAYIGTGEGHSMKGYGHYVGEAQGTGKQYRIKLAGTDQVPYGDDGFPLSYEETVRKYFEPGTVVPSYGGGFSRVESLDFDPNDPTRWNATTRPVRPDHDAMLAKYPDLQWERHLYNYNVPIPGEAMNDMSLWSDRTSNGLYQQPLNRHSTFPDDHQIAAVAHAKGWQMGDPGGLVHVNVIPEQHEFFDLDLPWKQQTPEIQDKMTQAGYDPYTLKLRNPDDATGEQIRIAATQAVRGPMRMTTDAAKQVVAEKMDAAGIPGNKYLDQFSRSKPYMAVLKHSDNFATAPNQDLAEHFLQGYPAYTDSLDRDLDIARRPIQDVIDTNKQGMALLDQTAIPSDALNYSTSLRREFEKRISDHQDLLDWMKQEQEAGNFSRGDVRTRNFTVTKGKNIDIRSWNGIPLTPVDHDPYITPGGGQ